MNQFSAGSAKDANIYLMKKRACEIVINPFNCEDAVAPWRACGALKRS